MFEPSLYISYVDATEFGKKTPVEVKLDYPPTATLFNMDNFPLILKNADQTPSAANLKSDVESLSNKTIKLSRCKNKKILKIKNIYIIYSFKNHNIFFYFSKSLWYLYDFYFIFRLFFKKTIQKMRMRVHSKKILKNI